MKAEDILNKNAIKQMREWELNYLKKTHPSLYTVIIESINEALEMPPIIVEFKAKEVKAICIKSYEDDDDLERYEDGEISRAAVRKYNKGEIHTVVDGRFSEEHYRKL